MIGPDPDESLSLLRRSGARDAEISAAALERLDAMLEAGHPHLASMHAEEYGRYWDDARKLDVLERFRAHDMETQAVMLCHRWRMYEACRIESPGLHRELFPPLPPRNKGDRA